MSMIKIHFINSGIDTDDDETINDYFINCNGTIKVTGETSYIINGSSLEEVVTALETEFENPKLIIGHIDEVTIGVWLNFKLNVDSCLK